ncbi:hypothetical protein K402DRAFT_355214 [Aulographum hederae CBS 113979]|uniref:Matrin-type domain-containing protein n=1 Tax=Aulographum hederae CBS 113979 TaxID=1176131 RepID=A0A6G1GZW5_9PEZI|nr:hypothetical protein K402DRAFT_355214 [Aulographum hederae CBS 113979]
MGKEEELRLFREDLERLEEATSDRYLEDPPTTRDRLNRDHEVREFVNHAHAQTERLLSLYKDESGARAREMQDLTTGDTFDSFYKEISQIIEHHRRYPNEPVEDLERAYKRRPLGEGEYPTVDRLFSGEEGSGRFFDLVARHDQYLNLAPVKNSKRITYLQYLDSFDFFLPPQCPIKRSDKMTEEYFQYLGELVQYLESFMRRIRPLEDIEKVLTSFDKDFEEAWAKDEVPGWEDESSAANGGDTVMGEGDGIWCADCQKSFKSEGLYEGHLKGKKHKKAVVEKSQRTTNGHTNGSGAADTGKHRLKERAVAYREYRIRKLVSAMQTERNDTRVNVERRQGMTEKERMKELAALTAESAGYEEQDEESDSGGEDDDDKIYNPLKLPLAWDGKPIPFWLYKLHGLGVEFPCEICGNFVYMGRRAFEKHFNEQRHIYGLRCLGINNTTMFKEITSIEEATKLWEKMEDDKKREKRKVENVVEMEDGSGNVMPEKVYNDLLKSGLLE